MNDQRQGDVHFLHIGKTGGTALKHALASAAEACGWLHLHDHITRLADVPAGQRVFFFLRDPVTRFVSGFYSRQRQGRPRYYEPWSAGEAAAFAAFTSPNQLALALWSEDDARHRQAVAAMQSIQHVHDSYWRWFGTPDELHRRRDDILFIGQQEHLVDDILVLARILKLDIADLPSDPIAAHRNPDGLDRRLDERAVANLIRWYAADYQAIEICAQIAYKAGFGGSLSVAHAQAAGGMDCATATPNCDQAWPTAYHRLPTAYRSRREHMQTPISYLICATERTGSYLLCDALTGTGIAGRPQECFHPAILARLWGQADRPDYAVAFDRIIQEGATPNGVFGAKIQWWQLKQFVLKLREVPEFRGIGAVELLQRWLPDVRYIRLTRRDKLRQAISYHKAAQTDVWWETDAWVRANRPAPAAQPTFDAAAIDGLARQIARHEAVWQLFFDTCGVQPLEIAYEDLVHDHVAVARQVLEYLQISVPGDLAIAPPRYKKQADDVTEQWVQRYRELKALPDASLTGAAPVAVAPEDRAIIVSQRSAKDGAPPIQPRDAGGRALRIVSYAAQPLDGLPALLARCIAAHTPHTADCLWSGPPPGAPPDPGAIDWMADPVAATTALVAADVVLLHDGEIAPQHQTMLKDKAVIVLAHRARAQQSPWPHMSVPGGVLRPDLAELPAFQGWPQLPLIDAQMEDFAQHWERCWMPLIMQALPPPEPHGNVVHRSSPTPRPVSMKEDCKRMNITAYALSDHAATLQPTPAERAWIDASAAVAADLALSNANSTGWDLLCPYAFEATWNGGPAPEDIAIRIDAPDADVPPFVQSQLGAGLLTFYPGYQFQITGPHNLWVRGPINRPKDGLAPLEQIVDTSLLPCTVAVAWQCIRPHQTVRFERGEPFAALLPYPKDYVDQFAVEVVRPDEAPEAYAQALAQRLQAPAIQDILLSLQFEDDPAAPPQPVAVATEQAGRWAAQLVDLPPVSCICPTYARVELLEEAIESFLRQDYLGQKELIVLNDYPAQTLVFDHPEVRVINVPQRFSSVGEKYKAAVALCSHDLIFVWHDDDIYLPHRLSFSVAQFAQKRGFFKAGEAWFWNDGQLSGPDRNTFHGGSCFSRALFAEAQGYPHVSSGFDIGFEAACEDQRVGATSSQALAPEDLYYLYRWAGTGSYHLSAAGRNGQAYGAVAAYVQEQVARGRVAPGSIVLNPQWKTDYPALVRDYLNNGHAKPAQVEELFPPPYFAIPGPQPMEEAAVASLFKGTHPARISVILPALNESVLLQRTVEQFQATLPANCEIIVVDNGSTDGSADFIPNCGCGGVALIRSERPLGVAGARNRGLEAARGEVIVFADAHIDLPERWWQPVVATLNRPNVGVVGPGIGIMGKPELNAACAQRIAEPNLRVEWLGWKQREPYPVPTLGGGFMAMRRETLEQAGGFDPGMPQWGSEDLELCVRYWLLGYEVWVVPDVTILHYFRNENPLKLKAGIVTHNVLRVALLHFNQERISRVISALREKSDFGPAMAHAVDSDVWQRRAEFAACRVRDDDWFFEKFQDTCPV